MQASNVTFLYSHYGLRLKSSRSDTPCLWLACCCWCMLPSNFIATAICGVSWIGSEELFFQVRGNSSKQKTMFCFPHWPHSWYNSENIHANTVWGLTNIYPSFTPDCSVDGVSSNAASTAKEQTKEIRNCDMRRRMISYPGKLPVLVCLWLPVPLAHDHAVNQAQHDTIMSYLK